MRSLTKLAILAIITVSATSAFAQNPPRNSYIDRRVTSAADLIRHVKTDKDVMDRYRRHFAMSDEEVIQYLSTLQVKQLDKDSVFTVYGVPRNDGVIHTHLRLLKKGEPLLVEPDGTPALMLVCGNPLLLGPQKPQIGNPVMTTTGVVEGPRTVTPEAPATPTPAQSTVISPGNPVPITPNYPPTTERKDSALPMILGLAGSLGLFLVHNNGHDCPPVPEPVSMVVVGGGLAAMAARRKLARAKSK